MKPIIIPIHSFVDLITNSSSEVFVSSTDSTLKTMRDVLQSIINVAGEHSNVDDLFELKLCADVGTYIWNTIEEFTGGEDGNTFTTIDEVRNALLGSVDDNDLEEIAKFVFDHRENEELDYPVDVKSPIYDFISSDYERPVTTSVIIKVLPGAEKYENIAKLVSKIQTTINAESYYG